MVRPGQRGYSILELVVSLGVLGAIILILAVLTAEMRKHQERQPMNFLKHPQISAVLARLRHDILDAYGANPFQPTRTYGYSQTRKTLVLETLLPNGGLQTIVWDFREPGLVRRRAFNVGVETQWVARGLPPDFDCQIDAEDLPGDGPFAVRIKAYDEEGNLAIDQIVQPRTHP